MKELDQTQLDMVSGGASIKGAIWGGIDFALTGMSIAGKYGGAGWWGFGALSQLVGYAVTPIVAGAGGVVIGFMYGQEVAQDLAEHYRETLG